MRERTLCPAQDVLPGILRTRADNHKSEGKRYLAADEKGQFQGKQARLLKWASLRSIEGNIEGFNDGGESAGVRPNCTDGDSATEPGETAGAMQAAAQPEFASDFR